MSYHGELAAIDLALEFCQPFFAAPTNINKIVILSDCQSAIETVSSFQYPSNFTKILRKIYEMVKLLSSKQIEIEILWIAAHTGIIGNELADKCAKAAAAEAEESTFKYSTPLSYSEIKKEIKQNITEAWQRQWARNEQSRTLHNIKPKVSTKSIKSSSNSLVDKRLNRITTDHSNLPEHRWRMNIPDTRHHFPLMSL